MIDTQALKQKILDMAIRGQLVPQDPNDEPASILLDKIRAEKQRLIEEGKIKKDKTDSTIYKGDDNRYYEKIGNEDPKCIDDELPFEIPDSWRWVRLPDIAKFNLGKTPDRGIKKYWSNGTYNWFSIADMQDKATVFESKERISKIALEEKFDGQLCARGTLMMSFKLTVGRTSILGTDAIHNEAIISIIPYYSKNNTIRNFLLNTLGLLVNYVNKTDAVKGNTLNSSKLKSMFIPLPPFIEQQRIIDCIERLYEYVNIIETNQTELEQLYDDLKKKTLDLAIRGKLVSQDTKDEPASELLKRIRAEKKTKLGKKYVESYIYKGDDNCYYEKVGTGVKNITEEIPFNIPENWAWVRLSNICSYIHRGKSPKYGMQKLLPIIAQKCNQWSGIQTDKCLFAEESTISNYTIEQYLQLGDIIINSTGTGTVGRTGIINNSLFTVYPKFVADSHVTVIRAFNKVQSEYIYLFLCSPIIQKDIENKCSGSTNQIELATSTVCNFLIPLPPYAEQKHIITTIYNVYKIIDKGEN